MTLRSAYGTFDWRTLEKDVLAKIARAHRGAMNEVTEGLKQALRDDVVAAGLGDRLAKVWRGKTYPRDSRETLDPAGTVYVTPGKARRGNAPRIIDFYSAANTINPVLADALAIPTKDCPRTGASRGAKRFMTPVEVEARFNAELVPRRLKSGRLGLFISVVPGLSTLKGGYRPVTKQRVAKGRVERLLLMFVLVRQVQGRKRLNHKSIDAQWRRKFPAILSGHLKLQGLE
jgi:hypothetical protein